MLAAQCVKPAELVSFSLCCRSRSKTFTASRYLFFSRSTLHTNIMDGHRTPNFASSPLAAERAAAHDTAPRHALGRRRHAQRQQHELLLLVLGEWRPVVNFDVVKVPARFRRRSVLAELVKPTMQRTCPGTAWRYGTAPASFWQHRPKRIATCPRRSSALLWPKQHLQ